MRSKLILAMVLAIALASAQRGGSGGGGMGGTMEGEEGGGSRMGRGGGMMGSTNRLDMWSEMLKLSKDQRKQCKTVMDEAQKEANPVKEQMLQARMALAEAVSTGKGQDEVGRAAAAVAASEARMHQIEIGAFVKIYQSLEKEQQVKVRPVFAMMNGIFKAKNWIDVN